MRRFFCLCLATTVLLAFAACGTEASPSAGSDPTSTQSANGKLGINDTLEAENFDFSIISVAKHTSIKNQIGVEYKADEGNVLVVIVLSAINTTSETRNVMYQFNSYIDGKKLPVESVIGEIGGYMPLVGAVSAGKYCEGYAVWEVPADGKELEFSYIDTLTGSESDAYLIFLDEMDLAK